VICFDSFYLLVLFNCETINVTISKMIYRYFYKKSVIRYFVYYRKTTGSQNRFQEPKLEPLFSAFAIRNRTGIDGSGTEPESTVPVRSPIILGTARLYCVLLQNTTKETHQFMGELKSSRIILRSFSLINHTEYRAHIVTDLNQFVIYALLLIAVVISSFTF